MSKTIYNFELKETSTEHHLISKSPNLIITTQGEAGVADVFMASAYGDYNHVEGFVSGEDKIQIPLNVIKAFNPASTIVKGPLPAERYGTGGGTPVDGIGCNEGLLFYNKDDGEPLLHLLTLDLLAVPAATDIEIV